MEKYEKDKKTKEKEIVSHSIFGKLPQALKSAYS